MRKLILLTLIVLSCQVSIAQNVKQLYYGSDIIIEAPVSYSFKAGVENIRKTVTVKVIVPNFRVEYNDIAQYIEGGGMGGFKYDLSFTRWYKRGEITSIIVDGATIPISEFTDNGNAGPIIFSDLSFSWWQKNYPVKRWSLGILSFRAELDNAEKRIGLSTDYFELKDFLGTETNKEAENNLKANGEIFARDLVFGEVKYYPSPNIGSYLAKKDARIAEETGSYTVNGFTNKVKESANPISSSSSNSSTGSTSSSGSTQTSSSTGSTKSEATTSTSEKSSSEETGKKTTEKENDSNPKYKPETPVERLERERGEREQMAADVAPGLVAISDAFTNFIGSSLNSVELTALYSANSYLSNFSYKLTFGFGSKELPEAGHVFGISGGLGFATIPKGSVTRISTSGNSVREINYSVININTFDYPSIYSLGGNFIGYLPNSSWLIGAQVEYSFFKFSDTYTYEWNNGSRNIQSDLTRDFDNSHWSYGISIRRPLSKIIGDTPMTKTTASLFLQAHLNYLEGSTKMTFTDDGNSLNTFSRLEELPNREFEGGFDYGISLVFRINIRMNK